MVPFLTLAGISNADGDDSSLKWQHLDAGFFLPALIRSERNYMHVQKRQIIKPKAPDREKIVPGEKVLLN